ncbi:MAG: hypothetical protein ACRDIU_07750 [Actinomycetota bacterium]
MARKAASPQLFARWFWLVYVPLALLVVSVVLKLAGMLPAWGNVVLILLALYSVLALKLLLERRKAGVGFGLPRPLVTGLAALSGILVLGITFFVLGVERLSTTGGLAMVLIGGFLMILSVTVPTFRMVDSILRFGGRLVGRASGRVRPPPERAARNTAGREDRPSPPRRPAGPAEASAGSPPGPAKSADGDGGKKPRAGSPESNASPAGRRSAQRTARSKPARRAPRHSAK